MKKAIVFVLICSLTLVSAACGGGGDGGNDVQANSAVKYLSDLEAMPGVSFIGYDWDELFFNGDPELVPGDIVVAYPGEYPNISVWGRGFLALIVPGDPAKTDRIAFDNMYEYEQLTVAETFDYVDQSGSANLSRLEGLQNDGVYGIYDKVDMADKTVTGLGNSINGEVYSDADMSFSMLNTVLGMTGTASYEMLREEGLQSGLDSFHFNLDGTASFDGTIDVSTTDTGGSIRFPIFTQLFPITDKGEVPMGIMLELIGNVQYNGSDPLDQQIAVDYEIPVTEDFTYDPVNGWVRTGTNNQAVVNHQMDSITQTEQDNNLYIRLELTFAVVIGGQCAGYSGMEMWFDSALWRESSTQPTDFGNITVTAEDHLIEADQVYWFAFYGENWLFGDDTSKADMSPSHMRYIKGYERFDKFELYRNVVYPILGAIKGTGANDIVMLTTSGASADVVDNKFVMYVNSTGDHTIEAQNVPEDYYLIGTTQVTIIEKTIMKPLSYQVVPGIILKP